MRLKIFTATLLIQAFLAGNSFAALPASTFKIVVIVNKDPISHSDLDDRIKLISLMSGISAKKQDMENMRNQVLQSLIQEKLQIKAAKDKKIEISDADVEKTLQGMAKDNNMSYDQFLGILSKNNIPKQTLVTRVRAQLAWVKYIRQQFAPIVYVTDSEVDKKIKKIKSAQNQTQYLVSEIMLLVSTPAQEQSVRGDANKLITDLKAGANFGMMAQQLSKDSNGANGGDLGWVSVEQIDPSVATVLTDLKPGEISKPIRTPAGFKIIKLREIRKAGEADPNEAQISFCQAFFPLTPTSTEQDLAVVGPKVDQTVAVSGCDAFKKKVKEFSIEYKHNVDIKMGQLPEQLKNMLKIAALGKCLDPIMTEQGLLVQMVCARKTPTLAPLNNEEIRADIEQQKLSLQATRELQRLLSVAYLDFKDQKYASVIK